MNEALEEDLRSVGWAIILMEKRNLDSTEVKKLWHELKEAYDESARIPQ